MTATALFSKIIALGMNRRPEPMRMSSDRDREQRKEFRKASDERLFLQIVNSDNRDVIGTTISCRALDVSANGLKIASEQQIPEGAAIDLWVDDSLNSGKYFLSSEVRWSEPMDNGFHVGLLLRESSATDIQAWRSRHG